MSLDQRTANQMSGIGTDDQLCGSINTARRPNFGCKNFQIMNKRTSSSKLCYYVLDDGGASSGYGA
ncbi:hypothetical protein ACLOJK_016568 [Asimina triloba]